MLEDDELVCALGDGGDVFDDPLLDPINGEDGLPEDISSFVTSASGFEGQDGYDTPVEFCNIHVADITKIRNPRNVELSFEQIKEIGGSDLLELAKEDAAPIIKKRLKSVTGESKKSVMTFLLSIHSLARSLQTGQINPVVVCRSSKLDPYFQLIAGERRVCASFFGNFSLIEAKVFNSMPSEADFLRITDDENNQREDLTLLEKIQSRRERYLLMVERSDSSVSSLLLSKELKCSKATAALYKKIFDYDDYDSIIALVMSNKLTSLRKITNYINQLENPVAKDGVKSKAVTIKDFGMVKWGSTVNVDPYIRIMEMCELSDPKLKTRLEGVSEMSAADVQSLFVDFMSSFSSK